MKNEIIHDREWFLFTYFNRREPKDLTYMEAAHGLRIARLHLMNLDLNGPEELIEFNHLKKILIEVNRRIKMLDSAIGTRSYGSGGRYEGRKLSYPATLIGGVKLLINWVSSVCKKAYFIYKNRIK